MTAPLLLCRIVTCKHIRALSEDLKALEFCAKHQLEFAKSSEALHPRPSSLSDFRDRHWKETCSVRAAEKWANATEVEREEWRKGGFGR